MPDVKQIYQSFADRYEALVRREDYEKNLLPAILAVSNLKGKEIIELGAGTGRLTCLIAPLTGRLTAADLSMHMLTLGRERLTDQHPCSFNLANHLALPYPANTADILIAGWSFCYAAIDAEENWQASLEKALGEAARVLRPNGTLILIESLGTGFEQPNKPQVLVDYLAYLETHGFQTTWIRTDYLFKDRAEAEDLTQFFFGDDPLPMWEAEGGVIVPECTGLWWKTFFN